jgi:hypothetical protein
VIAYNKKWSMFFMLFMTHKRHDLIPLKSMVLLIFFIFLEFQDYKYSSWSDNILLLTRLWEVKNDIQKILKAQWASIWRYTLLPAARFMKISTKFFFHRNQLQYCSELESQNIQRWVWSIIMRQITLNVYLNLDVQIYREPKDKSSSISSLKSRKWL